eukprot:CAMPEP_0174965808 /NCGR_PEP_ID=MMETSP0004_2-20121128/6639_1 /TAXON_ID=420556 /ORGANISM="Ochromonas sp., Strain CCMP1393" /LENGTH=311 /DNA_ID=CAMNT_0016214681 /DNA_START=96 /DNA_END=1028 /DNA_ORIENTATION=+
MSTAYTPLFSYGVISDPQYVDAIDGTNFAGTSVRRYRHSLSILDKAGRSFASHSTSCNIVLGDVLDGKANAFGIKEKCLQDIFDSTKKHTASDNWHYVLGNHDYYCFNREELYAKLIPSHIMDMCTPQKLYYHFSPQKGYRFIVLDGYEVSEMGAATPSDAEAALMILEANNPNIAAKTGGATWFKDLPEERRRFVPYNGALGTGQLQWLRETLANAAISQERVVIFSHMPVYLPCTHSNSILWNSEEVLDIIQSSDSVLAFVSGHDHGGGYAMDATGIHHIVPPAPLECEVGDVAFGRFEVFTDHMKLVW